LSSTPPGKISRRIPENLWRKSFLKSDGRYDGKKFEDLAFDLLNALYGKGWEPTGITRDGSRDFEKHDGDDWLWAECKAYSDRLSVYVISPTLVMAVIEQPNTVIVVSRSVLNDNASRHLAAFQNASGKRIIALDGPILDNAILDMGLSDRYFPDLIHVRPALCGLLVHVSVTPDTLREPTDSDFVPGVVGMRQPIAVVRYSLIRIDLVLRNLSASDNCKAQIEIVDKTLHPSIHLVSFGGLKHSRSISLSIPPAGVVRTSLVIQPLEATELLRLPDIVAGAPGVTNKLIKTGSVHVSHLYQIEIVGKTHKRILTHAARFIRGRREPAVISVEGTSGSGKSRLMMEIAKIGIEEGFRCHFYNPEFEDAKAAENVLKDLIADISELPRLRDWEEEASFPRGNSSILVRALYDPTFILWDHIADVVNAVVSILIRRPTILVIDNLQFTDDRFADFIDSLIVQLNHLGNKRLVLVLSINTDFTAPGSKVNELLAKLRARTQDELHRKTFYHSQLKEFGKDDVAEFVGAALSGQKTSASAASLYEKTLEVLIQKVEPKPLNLWQTLMYLADEGVLSLKDDRLMVSGNELLASRLDTIPSRLGDLLELRWARIRKNEAANGLSEEKLERTVRAIYFMGNETKVRLVEAGADKNAIERLVRVGILVNQASGFIQFFHSQVFAFFRMRFVSLRKRTALTLRAAFQRLKLHNLKFQQYFILCHYAGKVNSPLLVSSVRCMKDSGLTVDYGRQYSELLLLYFTVADKGISATALTGVTLIGEWQQRIDSLQTGQRTLRSFLTKHIMTRSRNGLPGPALFEFYTATINACLAVYEDNEAAEVITLALKDLRASKFPNRRIRNASLASVLNRKAATVKNFGRVDEALAAGFEALKRFQQIRDYSMVVETLFDLASVSFGASQKANEFFERGCELFRLHESVMREPAQCRYFYVSGRLAIQRRDLPSAFEMCRRGRHHAERVGRSFWGIRLVLLEAIARLLAGAKKGDLKVVNELLIKARDWANVSHAERSRTALSYLDGKLLVGMKEYGRATDAFSEAVRTLALRLTTPEQIACRADLLIDIASTCRRYHLDLDPNAISLLKNSGVRSQILEIQSMSNELFDTFEQKRIKRAEFSNRGQIIELP